MAATLPIEAVIAGATRRSMLRHDGAHLYWLEQRPELQGRGVIVRWAAASGCEDVTPPQLSVRSRVHEYGGAEFAVHKAALVFTAEPDQQVWLRSANGSLRALTAASVPAGSVRFADFVWHPSGQYIYAVRELHRSDDVTNELVILSVQGDCQVIASGADFYASPCVSSDGKQLAWLQWNNPQMPWDGTELVRAALIAPGTLATVRAVAGGANESVLQPGFSADNRLLAMNDRNGFWQLGVVTERGWQSVLNIEADCAVAPWSLGTRTWCESPSGSFWLIATRDGWQQLWRLSSSFAQAEPVALPQNGLAPQLAADAQHLFVLASSATQAESLLALGADAKPECTVCDPMPWPENVAIAAAESLKVVRGGRQIPANFYRPVGGQGKLPLVAFCHSGPTGSASPQLQPAIQFWTSRGYAVVDINYRGSDGYGRAWRQSLLGHWAEYDVADCLAVIEHLLGNGEVDPTRVFLRGNSAGGLTVLHMLARSQRIRAAAVRYPVVDLLSLAAISHKFEAHYLHQLVGGGEQALAAASPARHFAAIRTPMLIQQGELDTVVPLGQARQLADALAGAHVDHQLIVHPGEGHGFRRAATLAAALEAELQFFDRHR